VVAKPQINSDVLRWARDQAKLSLDEAAKRAGIPPTKNAVAAARLDSWERGESRPTQNQLLGLARAYRRPLVTFFLRTPPTPAPEIADFRTGISAAGAEGSPELASVLRQVRASQQEIRSMLVDDESEQLGFVGAGHSKSSDIVAQMIRAELGISMEEQSRATDVFKLVRSRAEAAGIFVQLIGNLGSHHSAIAPEEFRGFTLSDDLAPFIVLNPNDAQAALVFSLLHELAHLWRGEGGISNANPFESDSDAAGVEQFCNAVAAEFLLPTSELLASWRQHASRDDPRSAIESVARSFGVSSSAAACRLWKLGEISDELWWSLFREYGRRWQEARAAMKDREGGPSYHVVRQHQLGKALIRFVMSAVDSGDLSVVRAGRILRLPPAQLDAVRAAADG
jgi:Zn-dependent peptidase ImmA (M78 family)/transcriptional regulator with XRE-family HTH domain